MESKWPLSLLQPVNQGKDGSVGILEILRRKAHEMRTVSGGRPISYEEALSLRRIIRGSASHKLSSDFMSSSFCFGDEDGPFPYGLQVKRNGCRGIMMCVQAHILRQLIFQGKSREDIQKDNVLKPGGNLRRDALISAICEIVWRAGGEEKCCVAFPQGGDPVFTQTPDYRNDSATERLHLYEFSKQEDLNIFMKKNMDFFESGPTGGCYLLICSVVLSRGVDRVRGDLGGSSSCLITSSEDCSQAIINLLIIGHAVYGTSNSDELYDKTAKLLAQPKLGVNTRGSVGFLYWNKDEDDVSRTEVGSKLKTPRHPIWVTNVNGNYGLLFSLNPSLTRDWREEHCFDLYYYTGLNTQLSEVRLTVETHQERRCRGGGAASVKTDSKTVKEDKKIPALERCIKTKWFEAEVDWNGALAFI